MTQLQFGQALGALILRKRKAMGLSQLQLSEDAFGSSAKVRRISEIENGQVTNPHPKTIDPIIVALKITDAEVEECARQTEAVPDPDLDRAYREARNLIEAVAYQFEHNKPSATLAELDDFLRSKAKEWGTLRARVEAIDSADLAATKLKDEAALALAEGRFSDVDQMLAELEESFQQEATIAEIRKQSEIRRTRGDACLMKEDPDGALAHYLQAARYFQHFDENEMSEVLDETAHTIYEGSLRWIKPRFQIGLVLLEELLTLSVVQKDQARRTEAHYQLSLMYRNAASRGRGDASQGYLEKALQHARTAAADIDHSDAYKLVCTKISVSNCLFDLARLFGQLDNLPESVEALRTAEEIALTNPNAEKLLSIVCNCLGSNLLAERARQGNHSPENADEAFEKFSAAIRHAERHVDLEVWGAAKVNRARQLQLKSREDHRPDFERAFLRIQSIADYLASIEMNPVSIFPDRFADANYELASVLMEHALASPEPEAEFHLSRAIASFETASNIYHGIGVMSRWAAAQMGIGSIYLQHSRLPSNDQPAEDLDKALEHLQGALAFYKSEGPEQHVATCEQVITQARADLEKIRSS